MIKGAEFTRESSNNACKTVIRVRNLGNVELSCSVGWVERRFLLNQWHNKTKIKDAFKHLSLGSERDCMQSKIVQVLASLSLFHLCQHSTF